MIDMATKIQPFFLCRFIVISKSNKNIRNFYNKIPEFRQSNKENDLQKLTFYNKLETSFVFIWITYWNISSKKKKNKIGDELEFVCLYFPNQLKLQRLFNASFPFLLLKFHLINSRKFISLLLNYEYISIFKLDGFIICLNSTTKKSSSRMNHNHIKISYDSLVLHKYFARFKKKNRIIAYFIQKKLNRN